LRAKVRALSIISRIHFMKKIIFIFFLSLLFSNNALADCVETKWSKVELYMGLSKPGGGAVSLVEWQAFQKEVINKSFQGYNLKDSLGYWEGEPERSTVLTIVLNECEIPLAEVVSKKYAIRFDQQSVMLIKTDIDAPKFIGQDYKVSAEKVRSRKESTRSQAPAWERN